MGWVRSTGKRCCIRKKPYVNVGRCGVSFLDTVGTRQSIYLGSRREREGLNRSDGYIVTNDRARMLMSSDLGFQCEKRGPQCSKVHDYCDIRRSVISTDASCEDMTWCDTVARTVQSFHCDGADSTRYKHVSRSLPRIPQSARQYDV